MLLELNKIILFSLILTCFLSTNTFAKPQKVQTQQVSKAKAAPAQSNPAPSTSNQNPLSLFDQKGSKDPVYIKADQLTLHSKERKFEYAGNVELKQGDLLLISDSLVGLYDEKNQLKTASALKNVTITKGDGIKGSGERADFDKLSDTVVLSENPELQQNGSILTADRIRIFLKDNRSVAEGQVKVKLIKSGNGNNISDITKK